MLGNLLKSVGATLGLAPTKPPEFEVPAVLPKLQAKPTSEVIQASGMDAALFASAGSGLTTSKLLEIALNQQHDMLGATKAIAHALPQKEAVKWAADSARMVESKLPPEQKQALASADAFNERPSLSTRDAAATAAKKAGTNGPGGLAAQAAAFADVPGAPSIPGGDSLLPTCVTGAVVLAASISPPAVKAMPEFSPITTAAIPPPKSPGAPVVATPIQPEPAAVVKNTQTFKPFIDRGLALAAG